MYGMDISNSASRRFALESIYSPPPSPIRRCRRGRRRGLRRRRAPPSPGRRHRAPPPPALHAARPRRRRPRSPGLRRPRTSPTLRQRREEKEKQKRAMMRSRRRPSLGRQRIEIRPIENGGRRQVTFSKRRNGLFKKASELSTLCDASVAVVAFSKAGNVFAFGDPTVDAVLRRYDPLQAAADGAALAPAPAGGVEDGGDNDAVAGPDEELDALRRAAEQTKAQVVAEQARMCDVTDKITQAMAGRPFWWEADVEALGEAELPEFTRAVERLRDNVRRHANTLLSTTTPSPQQQQEEVPELDVSDYSF